MSVNGTPVSRQFDDWDDQRESKKYRNKDKSDRATVELVLDPCTRLILYKLLNRRCLDEINGCISTGKEANVYHATSKEGNFAVKIYKTSILVFKDRERYVTGEFRFRTGIIHARWSSYGLKKKCVISPMASTALDQCCYVIMF